MEPEDSQQPQKPAKGYSKRSMKQWILIYLVVAVVAYGLIYLIFIRDSGSSSGIY